MDIEDKQSKMEFWKDVSNIKRNVLDFINKKKPQKSRGTGRKKTTSSMEFCGMVVAKRETSKNIQSTTEWKENMKIEINRLIDTRILNPTTIITFGKKDYQKFMASKQILSTKGVSDENVTCELHNSQATNSPSACECSQSHFDVIEYQDDIMLTPKENTSMTNDSSDSSIYFRTDMLKAKLGRNNSSSPTNTNHDDSESRTFEPSPPFYSTDSEAPSDVKSTFISNTDKYSASTTSHDMASTKHGTINHEVHIPQPQRFK